jgi:hypothetical protein
VSFLSFDRPNNTLVRGLSSTISPMNQIEETNPMQTRQPPPTAGTKSSPRPVNYFRPNPPHSHTHVQHSCRCIHVYVPGVAGC